MSRSSVCAASTEWRPKRGLIALAICVLCAEGIVAGIDRACMPAFSLAILSGQMVLLNLFGAPEIMGLTAGIPAFFIAASPAGLDFRRYRLQVVFVGLVALAITLVVLARTGLTGFLLFAGIVVAGAVLGIAVRELEAVRRFWLPLGIASALLVGAVVFSFGHYGQNNCWP